MTVSNGEPGTLGRSGGRRRWTDEEKLRIVTESEEPGSSVSKVARRHDLNANMPFTWRRELRRRASAADVVQAGFTPAVIAPASVGQAMAPHERPEDTGDRPRRLAVGLMDIVLAGGKRVIVDREVSAAALARVIGVLERR